MSRRNTISREFFSTIAVVLIGAFCVFLALTQPGYYVVETVQVP